MLNLLRWSAILEGVSLLLLLFIAMPLKYLWQQPMAVEIVGMAHGVLFILYGFVLLISAPSLPLSYKATFLAFVAAFVPFGTFYADRRFFQKRRVASPK